MGRHHHTVDEDPSSRLVTKHIFSKMHVEASDHPFFKRVWLARHVLDENSPVLKPRVRRQIRKNGGSWPERLNTHYAIRESLKFNQILVSLNGVSNVSASDVYAQKIYDFVDINVGYQFVNILYRDSDGTLGVDVSLEGGSRAQQWVMWFRADVCTGTYLTFFISPDGSDQRRPRTEWRWRGTFNYGGIGLLDYSYAGPLCNTPISLYEYINSVSTPRYTSNCYTHKNNRQRKPLPSSG